MPHMTTICHVSAPKFEKSDGECVPEIHIVFLPPFVLMLRQAKKRPLPQRKICDKSLKRTHDIGHCCRDDAAMQRPAGKNLTGRLPFTPLSFY